MSCDAAAHVFATGGQLAEALAAEFARAARLAAAAGKMFCVALAGGSSPRGFYRCLAALPGKEMPSWRNVEVFWGDERCVPPEHPESNYRMAWEELLRNVPVPAANIHRIRGEDEPAREAERYAGEIAQYCPAAPGGFPRFDWIILGLGADGHTASIFPGAAAPAGAARFAAATAHPQSRQPRITLTMETINAAARIVFLVTGKEKAGVAAKILGKAPDGAGYPAARVQPRSGAVDWFLDQDAAAVWRGGAP